MIRDPREHALDHGGNLVEIVPSTRRCHGCDASLNFEGLVKANPALDASWLLKLWENEKIGFLCCNCYVMVESGENEEFMSGLLGR